MFFSASFRKFSANDTCTDKFVIMLMTFEISVWVDVMAVQWIVMAVQWIGSTVDCWRVVNGGVWVDVMAVQWIVDVWWLEQVQREWLATGKDCLRDRGSRRCLHTWFVDVTAISHSSTSHQTDWFLCFDYTQCLFATIFDNLLAEPQFARSWFFTAPKIISDRNLILNRPYVIISVKTGHQVFEILILYGTVYNTC